MPMATQRQKARCFIDAHGNLVRDLSEIGERRVVALVGVDNLAVVTPTRPSW